MKFIISLLIFLPSLCFAQYCVPTQGKAAIAPIINGVSIGAINNINSGFSLTDYGYSDYSNLTTTLEIGTSHTITISTDDFFPHNFGVWIDFNGDELFSDAEILDVFVLGGNNGMSKEIEFEVPASALNGTTRLRIRSMLEPFGPWNLSMTPCLPADGEGEIEDYSIEISGGIDNSVKLTAFSAPDSKVDLGMENITVELKNIGNTVAENIIAIFKVNDSVIFSESLPNSLEANTTSIFTFSENYDFSNIECENISVELEWANDENLTDNSLAKSICNLSPQHGQKVWYLHSNVNGGLEPLGEPPFASTTNEVTMNTVFGDDWQQAFFETANPSKIFADSSCVVFLDGSYDHNVPFEIFLAENTLLIENWVAAGGKLFLNFAIEQSQDFFVPLGFDHTELTFYQVGDAALKEEHTILDGPFQPLAQEYGGFYFATAIVIGRDLIPIAFEEIHKGLFNAPILNYPILAEKIWGEGKVIFGGLGASEEMQPMQASMNLRANVLAYLHECNVVSTSEKDLANEVKFFPNPVHSNLYFEELEISNKETTIQIFNQNGQLVFHDKLDNIRKINLAHLPTGFYFLELKIGDTTQIGKFIKN